MSRHLHCDADGCTQTTVADDCRWIVVSGEEVIGGCGTGRVYERHFCSYRCVGTWADGQAQVAASRLAKNRDTDMSPVVSKLDAYAESAGGNPNQRALTKPPA